jgi:hypothetical protein
VEEQCPHRLGTSRRCSQEPHTTEDEVHALPVVVDVPTAARVLGLGGNTAYELVRCGAWPTPLLRFGRLIKVPRRSLLELLRILDRRSG